MLKSWRCPEFCHSWPLGCSSSRSFSNTGPVLDW
jgi:hypothetical protein